MYKHSKIYVAGHTGLVGSALMRRLTEYTNVVTAPHFALDLRNLAEVRCFFEVEKPEYVVLAAARVGGILDNDTHPVEFIDANSRIQLNILRAAEESGVRKLLFLGSSCIYPRMAPQPIKEEYILDGKLEPTNDAYAIAKLSGIIACRSYNRQCGTQFVAAMPTNLYGPGDNFDLENSHVVPALIRKLATAAREDVSEVTLWGTGRAQREFLHVDDLADACVHILDNFVPASDALEDIIINVGSSAEVHIEYLAALIAYSIGYSGRIHWDTSKPDGTPRKVLDVSRMSALGWKSRIGLREGIESTCEWFRSKLATNEIRL